jgi:thioredoxin 1
MPAILLDEGAWRHEVVGTPGVTVVELWAGWCDPGESYRRVVDAVATDLEGRVRVVRLSESALPAAMRRYEVTSLPTLLLFRDGRLLGRVVGARERGRLLRELTDRLSLRRTGGR